ncbi:hypothetical protein KAR91_73600 [Candidatus Pacearchaeota archaeon]|nr:hypothetical protein [Candidatus Pacearchaeota archaeon]
MKFDIPLLNNPQSLIPLKNQFNGKNFTLETKLLDAIFIPYKDNKENVSSLLSELRWFTGNIFLIPSSSNDLIGLDLTPYPRAKNLCVDDPDFIFFYNNLKTSVHKLSVPNRFRWDLPLKRNYAVYFSIKKGFKKILLVDDDIININSSTIETGSFLLDKYTAVGSFIENYPDTSVVGHIQLKQGVDLKCFLSGSFLFVSPHKINSFFPKIYNEDWVFMTPLILNSEICSVGEIKQKAYDPFSSPEKAIFQEFGEVIAEGLFALLNKSAFNFRYDNDAWEEIIENRKVELLDLQQNVKPDIQQNIITCALEQNSKILPTDCTEYLHSLDEDIMSWELFLKEI